MKMLKHFNWEHEIMFNDGSITHLIIENPITLRNYILELNKQINGDDGNFVLSEGMQEISIPKNIALVTNPITLEFDEKRINTKINKDLLQLVARSSEIQKTTFPLLSMLEQYAESLTEEYGYNITYSNIDESGIIKMLNFRINQEYASSADKLLEWMNITHDILQIENFVILNLPLYFSEKELSLLCSEASSSKHNLLLIDRVNLHKTIGMEIIIDEDNCELYNIPIL